MKKYLGCVIVLFLLVISPVNGFFDQNCFCFNWGLSGDFYLRTDFLYWRAFESGLDTCVPKHVSNKIKSNGKVVSTFSGETHEPDFKWNPGFRVTLGYGIPSNWDSEVIWTHFHSHSKSHKHKNHFNWTMDLDVIDPVIGYGFCFNQDFVLRPFGGLRFVRIDQKITNDLSISRSSFSFIDNKEKLTGVGPLFGVEANWGLMYDMSLYANASISWIYGHFHVNLSESNGTNETVESFSSNKHLNAIVAVADAGIGIRWKACLSRKVKLILQLGLEHHRYFDYSRFNGYSDLSFDGVNFSAGIVF